MPNHVILMIIYMYLIYTIKKDPKMWLYSLVPRLSAHLFFFRLSYYVQKKLGRGPGNEASGYIHVHVHWHIHIPLCSVRLHPPTRTFLLELQPQSFDEGVQHVSSWSSSQ